MPKAYTDLEKQHIVERLKTEGKLLFSQYGIKKTTIDELVNRVHIPKGTFYLFYKSKEIFLFELLLEEQAKIQSDLIHSVKSYGTSLTKEMFTELVYDLVESCSSSFFFTILVNGEYELLLRKLPQEALNQNINDDDKNIEMLISLIPSAEKVDVQLFSAAFRAILLTTLHKQEIGNDVYPQTLKLLIAGLFQQLFEGAL